MTSRCWRLVAGSILLLLSSRSVLAQNGQIDLAALHTEAMMRFRSGRYDEALTLYRRLVQVQPGNTDAKKDLMWALWNAGHFEDAGRVASDILTAHPDDVEAKNLVTRVPSEANRDKMKTVHEEAVASYQAGDYTKSIQNYRELARLSPRNPLVLRDLMWALWNQDRYEEAAKVADQIMTLRPSDPDAADVLTRLPEALKVRQIIIKREKIAAIEKQAKDNEDAKQYEQAIPLLRELITLDPGNPANFNQLLSSLRKAGRYDEGLLVAQQMAVIHKEDPDSWNWLGTLELDMGDSQKALESFQNALTLKPDQARTQLAMGKMYVTMREFDNAIPLLQAAVKTDASLVEAYPLLGKALYWSGDFQPSTEAWVQAVKYFPQQVSYRFYEAEAFFYARHQDLARAQMKQLATQDHYVQAFDFLVNDAIVRKEDAEAERMLEGALQTIHPQDEGHVMKLVYLYQSNGQKDKLIALLDRFLAVSPDHEPAMLMKAAALFDKELFPEALEVYKKVHSLNPYDTEGLRGMAECELSMGHAAPALDYIHQFLALDPTNPRSVLTVAQYYEWAGQSREAKKVLLHWVHKNQNSPVLPIVLYHGLTPFSDDPLLAAPYHYTIMTFDDHMRALHDAGYTPVTAKDVQAWIYGKAALPKRPVLITFDDGRLDSFRYADPILEKYDLKATMCAALVNIEGFRPPGFVPWQRMAAYHETGRWEIESHGDISHIYIPIDSKGNQSLFLTSKKWLQDQNRMETDAEWIERLRSDRESSATPVRRRLVSERSIYRPRREAIQGLCG